MHIRNLTAVILIPLIVLVGTVPAHGFIGGAIQRAIMIANQLTMIANQGVSIATLNGQLTQLTDQFSHLKDQALGSVGAITQPFTDLASLPTALISTGMTWKNDFTGEARSLANAVEDMSRSGTSFTQSWRTKLQQADQVSEHDILALYTDLPPELSQQAAANYHNARERGNKRLVLNYALSDAAASSAAAIKSALESYEGLRNNTNKSDTALAQSQVAGMVTQGQLAASLAQLRAAQAAEDAAEALEAEKQRRERLGEWVEAQRRGAQTYRDRLAGIAALSDGGEGLRMRIHPLYGGESN